MPIPLLISFEGIDGSGKTSLIQEVASQLHRRQIVSKVLKPAIYTLNSIRAYAKSKGIDDHRSLFDNHFRHESYFIDMHMQWHGMSATPDSGIQLVLADRWPADTRFFFDELKYHSEFVALLLEQLPQPTRTFMIDVDQRTALLRLKKKRDWMTRCWSDAEIFEYMNKLQSFYRDYSGRTYVSVIDGNVPIKLLANSVCQIIEPLIDSRET